MLDCDRYKEIREQGTKKTNENQYYDLLDENDKIVL